MTALGLILLLVAAFALFAVGDWMARRRADPETRAEADRVFDAELADIPEDGDDA